MMTPDQIHRAAHAELRRDFAAIGLELADFIPLSWEACRKAALGQASDGPMLWMCAILHIAHVASTHVIADGLELLSQMLDLRISIRRRSRAETRILKNQLLQLPHYKHVFRGKPSIPYAVEIGGVPAFANARSKTWGGMLRRYVLKGDPSVAHLDAMAAWFVVPGEERDGSRAVPTALQSWFEAQGYALVGHLKTNASSGSYEALTYQREEFAGGVRLGQEVKLFTFEQFREAEIDPCSDSARSRYERRRLLELAAKLGFPCTTVYFVRHGETQANADGILHGSTSSPLTCRAQSDARVVGLEFYLKHRVRPTTIISSDLPRALQTAQLFTERFPRPIELRRGLRERKLGMFEGKPRPIGLEGHGLFARFKHRTPIPGGGEAFATVEARALACLEGDVERCIGGDLLVFSHAGAMRALLGTIDGVAPELHWDLQSAPFLKPQIRHVPVGYLRVASGAGRQDTGGQLSARVAA